MEVLQGDRGSDQLDLLKCELKFESLSDRDLLKLASLVGLLKGDPLEDLLRLEFLVRFQGELQGDSGPLLSGGRTLLQKGHLVSDDDL